MSLERQCTRCCDSLMRLGHALLDSPSQPRALWLLTRVADFLLKVRTGEWDTSIREFLKGLQAVRHFPEKPYRAAGVTGEISRGSARPTGAGADVNRL